MLYASHRYSYTSIRGTLGSLFETSDLRRRKVLYCPSLNVELYMEKLHGGPILLFLYELCCPEHPSVLDICIKLALEDPNSSKVIGG